MKIIRVPLDDQDQAKLLKDREGEPYAKPVLGTASVLSFIVSLYIFVFSGWELLDKVLVGGFLIVFGVMAYVGIFLTKKYYAKNNADSKAGEKEVIVGTITQKKEISRKNSPNVYYFYIDGEEIIIPVEYYLHFEEGSIVAIHRAPLSELVLKVEAYE